VVCVAVADLVSGLNQLKLRAQYRKPKPKP